ncbi:GH32 C-terminal domain-containing protein [Enorma phocaeensis]|uniref:GH32 C-terminal domain-containing protein n=1 Tax=Enorma phocaeensis TaxID=1871019 RepID=UPI003F4FAF90
MRVPVDASAVEVYASGGRDVLSTRWFPVAEELSVALHGSCAAGHVWAMGDGMAGTY